MSTSPPSPQPRPGEPHPAMRLAELVGLILAALGGGWFGVWRFLPGGRAMWAQLQALARDFTRIMERIAMGLPAQSAAASRSSRVPADGCHETQSPRIRPEHQRGRAGVSYTGIIATVAASQARESERAREIPRESGTNRPRATPPQPVPWLRPPAWFSKAFPPGSPPLAHFVAI